MKTLRTFLIVISIVFTSNSIAQTVFITKTGEKYHKKSCRYLKYSKKEIKSLLKYLLILTNILQWLLI